MINSFIREGDLVARVGKHKLYSSDVVKYIPKGISKDDSTIMAHRYIDLWTSNMLYMDVAKEELSKTELDVNEELEDYRQSLLKYRYEQKYINQHLDTLVTDKEIQEYYEKGGNRFRLDAPIAKVRFIKVAKSSNLSKLKQMLSVSEDEINLGDNSAFLSIIKYSNFGKKWIPVSVISSELGMTVREFMAKIKNGYVEEIDNEGNINLVYITDLKNVGQPGPIDYYRDNIKDMLLSTRKRAILLGLEQELKEKALKEGNMVIY